MARDLLNAHRPRPQNAGFSETLAGRIAFHELGGFRLSDLGPDSVTDLWVRGGLPRSFLVATEDESLMWRRQYISTFLGRDIPQLGITIPARTLRRFWTMLSHYHDQVLNSSELGRSFGVRETGYGDDHENRADRQGDDDAALAGRGGGCRLTTREPHFSDRLARHRGVLLQLRRQHQCGLRLWCGRKPAVGGGWGGVTASGRGCRGGSTAG